MKINGTGFGDISSNPVVRESHSMTDRLATAALGKLEGDHAEQVKLVNAMVAGVLGAFVRRLVKSGMRARGATEILTLLVKRMHDEVSDNQETIRKAFKKKATKVQDDADGD